MFVVGCLCLWFLWLLPMLFTVLTADAFMVCFAVVIVFIGAAVVVVVAVVSDCVCWCC